MSDDPPSSTTGPGEHPVLSAIGVAHTPYESTHEAPHQGFADDEESTIEVYESYADALEGVEDAVRLTVVYWADGARRDSLQDDDDDGVGAFAKRTPNRPNPLNICTCTSLGRDGRRLRVRGLDAVDGSPVVDIKPALQAEM